MWEQNRQYHEGKIVRNDYFYDLARPNIPSCFRRSPFAGWVGLFCLLLASPCPAEPVRVTTWNLQFHRRATAGSGTNQIPLPLAAATLKELNPDILLLQHVRDWQMCVDLVQALKPADYNVVVCSSLGEQGAPGHEQVAILAKERAYFSWFENWREQSPNKPGGGLAFAALRIGNQRVGVFSAELDIPSSILLGGPGRAADAQSTSARQLLEQVDSIRNWVTNRVQAFVIAGSLYPLRRDLPTPKTSALHLLEDAQFFDACQQVPVSLRPTEGPAGEQAGSTTDYIFAELPALVSHPQILPVSFAEHFPVTCDIEVDPAKIASLQAARAESPSAAQVSRVVQSDSVTPEPAPSKPNAPQLSLLDPQLLKWMAAGAGAILALTASILVLAKRNSRRNASALALVPSSLQSSTSALPAYTVVVAPRSTTASVPEAPSIPSSARPLLHIEPPGVTETQSAAWQERALAAERRAEQASAIVRRGLLPHLGQWLKHKLVRRLIADRTQLLHTQQAATLKALAVDERLARIEAQVHQQIQVYERRIEELTRELLAAKEENRELIRTKINQVKAEMEAARARIRAQASKDTGLA
jgi:hypothetical protein